MPAYTSNRNLYLPGGGSLSIGGDDEALDIDKINQNMEALDTWSGTVDAALLANSAFVAAQTSRNQQYRGTAADRPTQTGLRGDTYRDTDSPFLSWVHDGSSWVLDSPAAQTIRPTTVSGTGSSIAADSTVAFGSGTAVRINGAFLSRFRVFDIYIEITTASASGDITFQYSNAGSDVGGSASSGAYLEFGSATGPTRVAGLSGAFRVGRFGSNGAHAHLNVANPAQTNRKFLQFESVDSDAYVRQGGSFTDLTTAVDGFILRFSSAATGVVRIVGAGA